MLKKIWEWIMAILGLRKQTPDVPPLPDINYNNVDKDPVYTPEVDNPKSEDCEGAGKKKRGRPKKKV